VEQTVFSLKCLSKQCKFSTQKKLEDTKVVIRGHKSKDRQYSDKKKNDQDNQWSIKHTQKTRLSNVNSTENQG